MRRVGLLCQLQKETVGLAKGGQPNQRSTGLADNPVDKPTFASQGIDFTIC